MCSLMDDILAKVASSTRRRPGAAAGAAAGALGAALAVASSPRPPRTAAARDPAPACCQTPRVVLQQNRSRVCQSCGVVVEVLSAELSYDDRHGAYYERPVKTGMEIARQGVESADMTRKRHLATSGTLFSRRVAMKLGSCASRLQKEGVRASQTAEGVSSKGEACNRSLQRWLTPLFQSARTSSETEQAVRLAAFDLVRKTEAHRDVCTAKRCRSEWSFVEAKWKHLALAIAEETASALPCTACSTRLVAQCKTVSTHGMAQLRAQLRVVLDASFVEVQRQCTGHDTRTKRESRAVVRVCVRVNRMHSEGTIDYKEQHRAHVLLAEDSATTHCVEMLSLPLDPSVVAAVVVAASSPGKERLLQSAVEAHDAVATLSECQRRVAALSKHAEPARSEVGEEALM